MQSKASGTYVYGFREVEFYGTVYRPEDGYCEIAPSRLPLGEVHPGYGAVCATGAVFTASVTEVSYNGGNYRLAGWRREKWTDAGWATVENGTGTSFEYSPDGGIYRFSWEWAADAVRLATSIENDLGVERIEISPASADGFYAADEVVTLTARGATAPHTSSFVCWKGDLPDGTDASSPVISVTMDRARTITAQFDRSGWRWTLMPDFALDGATVPVLTDGLWILRVSDCTAGTAEGKQIDSCLNGYGMLDLSQVKSEASLDVLAIADGAFDGNKSITGLKCPEELVRIGKQAFNEAKNLDSVEFGANLESIGLKAFHHCRFDYATLDLSRCDKLREIGSYAFQYAKAERVILPPRIPEFGLQVFTYMEKLLEVAATVPGNDQFKAVKKASFPRADVFGGCAKLRTVEIPGGSAVSFTSLRGLPQLRKVKFHGKAPTAFPDFFSAFGTVQAPPSYQVRIEVSPNVDAAGWLAHARAATDEELSRTDCPGANVAGVIDCANGNKAWLTWGKSMFDPKGLVVTIR